MIRKNRIAIFLCFLFVSTALAQDYVVGEGDVLKIEVYDNNDLTTLTRVGSDGTILFPLIGQVHVAGKTVPHVAKIIGDHLAKGYIVNPQVTVFIMEFRSQKATLIGEISKPGLYVISGHTTFLQLLSIAGGLTKEAGDLAIVKRKSRPDEPEKIMTVDLKKLIRDGDASQDIEVRDNDSVYVMRGGIFYVTGEVRKPDSYKYEEGMTVLMATAKAGGFTDKAGDGRIRIIRKKDGKEIVLKNVTFDELVQPDDVIIVPESFF